ncbi:MAG: proton-conducting transporter membrane subunit [Collinsella sp.]
MAALYHTFNHAMFKGELFLGAGALLYSTGTRNMEKMGGLFRRMPATAICFLVGALAISAIPPFNGFVSEWFTYQSLFNAAMQGDKAVMIVAVFAAVALAITGALAVTCFVKAYGVSSRAAPLRGGRERQGVPGSDVVLQMLLAAICVVLGIAPVIAPVLATSPSVLTGSASQPPRACLW